MVCMDGMVWYTGDLPPLFFDGLSLAGTGAANFLFAAQMAGLIGKLFINRTSATNNNITGYLFYLVCPAFAGVGASQNNEERQVLAVYQQHTTGGTYRTP